jgi:hypothetical protein
MTEPSSIKSLTGNQKTEIASTSKNCHHERMTERLSLQLEGLTFRGPQFALRDWLRWEDGALPC